MKKILISILAAAALAGCSKSENNGGGDPAGSAAIVLSAGVPAATVAPQGKAPIVSGSTFTAGVAGWESRSGSATYTDATAWTTTASITANATAQNITLTATQVYSPDKDVKSYMKAWYPAGTLTFGVVTFSNADGTADPLLAAEVVGSKSDRTGKTLSFAHKTTQLKFVVKEGQGLSAGTTIDKIAVKGAQLPTGFDLSTDAATFAAAADLNVPGITAGAITIGTTEAGDAAGDPVMIKPMTGNRITLDIATNKAAYEDVTATIDTDEHFVEGKAYTITLTFGQAGIDLSATVAEWTTGTGSGSVE